MHSIRGGSAGSRLIILAPTANRASATMTGTAARRVTGLRGAAAALPISSCKHEATTNMSHH
eukprot:914161-Pleurochrysis_carterae.AAC.1